MPREMTPPAPIPKLTSPPPQLPPHPLATPPEGEAEGVREGGGMQRRVWRERKRGGERVGTGRQG